MVVRSLTVWAARAQSTMNGIMLAGHIIMVLGGPNMEDVNLLDTLCKHHKVAVYRFL